MTGITWEGAAAVAAGAALGALCRWLLTVGLGSVGRLAAGTLAANLVGCFAAGILAGCFAVFPVNDALRLLLVTGFLGGLTTFSTFSTESVGFLLDGAWGRWTRHLLVHVIGSLAAATAGVLMIRSFLR